MPLSDKHERFCQEYLVDLNATAAASRAGYKEPNKQGPRLLVNVGIAARIEELLAARSERTEITADRVLREIANVAFYNLAEISALRDQLGERIPINGPADLTLLPEALQRAVIGWSWDKNGRFTIKFADKLAALDMLGKHLGMWTLKVDHSGSIGFLNELAALPTEVLDRQLAEAESRKAP